MLRPLCLAARTAGTSAIRYNASAIFRKELTPFILQGSRQSVPRRLVHATLGPDAANPTQVTQPTKDATGQVLRVSITEPAVAKLRSLMETDNRPNMVLKIHVESGGCHGFQYVFDLKDEDVVTPSDSIFSRGGAKVVIDHKSLQILRDSSIDYSTELIGSQFKVISPHTSSACGCGSSFSIDP